MYNEGCKEKFIEDFGKNVYDIKDILTRIFEKSNTIEQELKKDISLFNLKEIDIFFNSLEFGSLYPLLFYRKLLNRYCKWSDIEVNFFDSIPDTKMEEYIFEPNNSLIEEGKVISLNNLTRLVNQLINPCDRCILYSLFEGVKGFRYEAMLNLKETNFFKGTEEWIVELERTGKFPVSEEFAQTAKESANTYTYISYTIENDRLRLNPLMNQDLVIKPRANSYSNKSGRSKMEKRIANIREMLNVPDLSITVLRYSGLVHYTKKKAGEIGITAIELCRQLEFNEVMARFGLGSEPKRLELLLSKFLEK